MMRKFGYIFLILILFTAQLTVSAHFHDDINIASQTPCSICMTAEELSETDTPKPAVIPTVVYSFIFTDIKLNDPITPASSVEVYYTRAPPFA